MSSRQLEGTASQPRPSLAASIHNPLRRPTLPPITAGNIPQKADNGNNTHNTDIPVFLSSPSTNARVIASRNAHPYTSHRLHNICVISVPRLSTNLPQTLKTFTLFPRLPAELRLKIWRYAAFFERHHNLDIDSSQYTILDPKLSPQAPIILQICPQVREECLKFFIRVSIRHLRTSAEHQLTNLNHAYSYRNQPLNQQGLTTHDQYEFDPSIIERYIYVNLDSDVFHQPPVPRILIPTNGPNFIVGNFGAQLQNLAQLNPLFAGATVIPGFPPGQGPVAQNFTWEQLAITSYRMPHSVLAKVKHLRMNFLTFMAAGTIHFMDLPLAARNLETITFLFNWSDMAPRSEDSLDSELQIKGLQTALRRVIQTTQTHFRGQDSDWVLSDWLANTKFKFHWETDGTIGEEDVSWDLGPAPTWQRLRVTQDAMGGVGLPYTKVERLPEDFEG